ncbi:MAG TPA: TlpA disulfide reductase family protein [Polyangiales bacterium]|nr:TlpA disulfide reductase family protein [Polyangiales bacterium]
MALAVVLFVHVDLAFALDAGARVPSIGLPDLAGHNVEVQRGKVTIVDVWASWCGPCKEELPALDRLYRKHRASGLRVIGVNIDKTADTMQTFLKAHPVSFTIVHDPDKVVVARFEPGTMPSSYLIDSHGLVKQVYRGYHAGDDKKLERDALALLDELPKPKPAQSADSAPPPSPVPAEPIEPTPEPAPTEQPTADARPASEPAAAATNAAPVADRKPPPVAPSAAQRSGGLCSISARSREKTGASFALVGLLVTAAYLSRKRARARV